MWAVQILMAVIGLSSGIVVAGGLFSLIAGLGVISDFADRTHTGEQILLYEDAVALGGFWEIFSSFIRSIFREVTGLFQYLAFWEESSWGAGQWRLRKC